MQIDQEAMENALMYLTQTDEDFARLKALVNGLERQVKTIKAMAFKASRETSVSAKEQDAYASGEYQNHLRKIEIAEREMLEFQERRNTAVTTIDCWRSLNAARSRGMM